MATITLHALRPDPGPADERAAYCGDPEPLTWTKPPMRSPLHPLPETQLCRACLRTARRELVAR